MMNNNQKKSTVKENNKSNIKIKEVISKKKKKTLGSKKGDTSVSLAFKIVITVVLSGMVFLVITGIINNTYVPGLVDQTNDITSKDTVSDTVHERDL